MLLNCSYVTQKSSCQGASLAHVGTKPFQSAVNPVHACVRKKRVRVFCIVRHLCDDAKQASNHTDTF